MADFGVSAVGGSSGAAPPNAEVLLGLRPMSVAEFHVVKMHVSLLRLVVQTRQVYSA